MQNELNAPHPPWERKRTEQADKRLGVNTTARLRCDTSMAAAVNKGLAAALLSDLPAGFKVMSDADVPTSVIIRVFLHPNQRRASDWKNE